MPHLRPLLVALLSFGAAEPIDDDLWNGRDLSGFYTYLEKSGKNNDPDKVFSVVDGTLRVSGREFGYLATEKEYENYFLTVEFKWGVATWPPREKKARDSGILFHVQGEDKIWPQSFEFQMIEGGTGDLLLLGGPSIEFDADLHCRFTEPYKMTSPDGSRVMRGRINWAKRSPRWKDVLGFRGEDDLERPVGEWNTLELECRDDRFTYWVNGTKVVEARGALPRKGRILFQTEGAELYFRTIRLRPLS